jgi:hypothetical protein
VRGSETTRGLPGAKYLCATVRTQRTVCSWSVVSVLTVSGTAAWVTAVSSSSCSMLIDMSVRDIWKEKCFGMLEIVINITSIYKLKLLLIGAWSSVFSERNQNKILYCPFLYPVVGRKVIIQDVVFVWLNKSTLHTWTQSSTSRPQDTSNSFDRDGAAGYGMLQFLLLTILFFNINSSCCVSSRNYNIQWSSLTPKLNTEFTHFWQSGLSWLRSVLNHSCRSVHYWTLTAFLYSIEPLLQVSTLLKPYCRSLHYWTLTAVQCIIERLLQVSTLSNAYCRSVHYWTLTAVQYIIEPLLPFSTLLNPYCLSVQYWTITAFQYNIEHLLPFNTLLNHYCCSVNDWNLTAVQCIIEPLLPFNTLLNTYCR